MATIYLSPSTQPYNLYVTGGSEQDFMNRLANDMEPYLTAAGIQFVRKGLTMTAADAIAASNRGNYDLHLGLHSNASPENIAGQQRGIIVFYNPASSESREASALIADRLKTIYPLPDQVRIEPSTNIGEVHRVSAPAAFLELGYHDNREDALWVSNNTQAIAESIVGALATYFGTPALTPEAPRRGLVDLRQGVLNIRARPSTAAPVIAQAPDDSLLTVLNTYRDWYLVQFGQNLGYAAARFIEILD